MLLGAPPFTLVSTFFATALALALTPGFLGAAVFLVTPTGLAALVPEVEVAVGEVLVFAFLGLTVRLMAGSVSTVWKTRGFELPVADRVPSRAIFETEGKLRDCLGIQR